MSQIVQKEQKQPQRASVCIFKRLLKLDYIKYIMKTQDDEVAGLKKWKRGTEEKTTERNKVIIK